jgi:small subunit ribosomal protein S23
VAQFRSLRSEHHIATTFAAMEAQELGSTFGTSEIEHSFELQKKGLSTWEKKEEQDEGALAAQKRWKAIVERRHGADQWSKGEEYVRLWQQGVKPNYMPVLVPSRQEQQHQQRQATVQKDRDLKASVKPPAQYY